MASRCEFLLSDTSDCGAEARRAVSVRHQVSDVWQRWPVCVEHERALVDELRGIGFVVSALYEVDDMAARRAAQRAADAA